MKKTVFFCSCFLLFIDQLSKYLMQNFMARDCFVIIPHFFQLEYLENPGASFGMFANQRVLLIILGIIALWAIYKTQRTLLPGVFTDFSFSLIYAGIVGNLIDRLFFGTVRDFFSFRFFGYDFPIFNLADVFIVIGAFCFMIVVLRSERVGKVYSRRKSRE